MSIKIKVRECITEDGIFAGDWSGVDQDASAQKYIDILTERITAEFPDAEIDVEGINEQTLTPVDVITDRFETEDFNTVQRAEDTISNIIADVYQDYKSWVVNE